MSHKEKGVTHTCPGCGDSSISVFFEMPGMPTYVNFLWPSAKESLECPRGDIALGMCEGCGLITNVSFNESLLEYREGYENSLHFSTVFQKYAGDLADDLIDRYELRGKRIIDVGCGRGDFLVMLCDRGENHGVGFDPSHTTPPDHADPDRVKFVRDLYSEQYADYDSDFVCSRHTLEHVRKPQDLLGPVRKSLGTRSDTPVFFEVPNGLYTLHNLFIWDVIYEHISYFTAPSLRRAFERAGFRVVKTYETFDGQYLCIEAYPSDDVGASRGGADVDRLGMDVDDFKAKYQAYVATWRDRLESLKSRGKTAVFWGAGSKGVTFLNMFAAADQIRYVVDVNPNKHGMFIAGAGLEIASPERLADEPPDTIIVANPIYGDEIKALAAERGSNPEFLYL